MFVNEFSGTSKPGNLKVCIPFEYSVLEYQLPPAYHSFYLFIFFPNKSFWLLFESQSSKFVYTGAEAKLIYSENIMLKFIVTLCRFSFFHISLQ